MKTAKDIMNKEVITVPTDLAVNELASLFMEKKISGAVVVNGDGGVQGVVTESDLIDQKKNLHIPTVAAILDAVIMLENPFKLDKEFKKMTGTTVGDIATMDPVTVTEDTSFEELASIMADKGLHTLPVVSNGKLTGVIGKTDIIRAISSGL